MATFQWCHYPVSVTFPTMSHEPSYISNCDSLVIDLEISSHIDWPFRVGANSSLKKPVVCLHSLTWLANRVAVASGLTLNAKICHPQGPVHCS